MVVSVRTLTPSANPLVSPSYHFLAIADAFDGPVAAEVGELSGLRIDIELGEQETDPDNAADNAWPRPFTE